LRNRIRFSPRAFADLDEIGEYIARENPDRAATFVDELEDACSRVAENPLAYPLRADLAADLRMAVHKNYLIFFRTLPGEIRIERILHGARNLHRFWQS
jgi:toxin ParE1/3/4